MDARRRVLLLALAIGFGTAPLGAAAQPAGKMHRVGYLETGDMRPAPWQAFRERLRELGYVEGRTVTFETRWAGGRLDQLPGLASELLRLRVDVLVTAGSPATRAAKSATASVPIVMATGGDPVALGLVRSLARPGGNVTGLTTLSRELSGKRLEIVKDALPGASRVGLLWHRSSDIDALTRRETENAAQALGLPLKAVGVDGPDEQPTKFELSINVRTAKALGLAIPSAVLARADVLLQ